MDITRDIEELESELECTRENCREYLEQRNTARQLAYDLAGALEYWRLQYGLPLAQEKLMQKMDRARGVGGYEWPQGVVR